MAVLATFTLVGDKELDAAFIELPKRLQKKVLRPAVRAAAKIIQEQAKANIHSISGTAAESIKVKAAKRSRSTPDQVAVNVISSAGWFKGDDFYLGMVEKGFLLGSKKAYTFTTTGGKTVTRYKLGKRWIAQRKPVAGKHQVERAYQAQAEAAKAVALEIIAQGIEREAAELGRTSGK